ASRFNDDGVTALYQAMVPALNAHGLKLPLQTGKLAPVSVKSSSFSRAVVPAARSRYLSEISDTVRGYHGEVAKQVKIARERQALKTVRHLFEAAEKPVSGFDELITAKAEAQSQTASRLLEGWPKLRETYSGDVHVVRIRDKELRTRLTTESLSGTRI